MAGKKGQYSLEEKREALVLAAEVGVCEAARRLSMPSGTLAQWRWKARQVKAKGGYWPPRVEPRDEDAVEEA